MITTVVSRKGGVGKTTTAVNLADALARIGRRVLLVDLDAQASASLSLGVPRSELAPSAADFLLRPGSIRDVLRPTETPGLELVSGSSDLAMADQTLAQLPGKEKVLGRALREVEDEFDFVLLDCPPALSLLSTNALLAADNFIVPVVPQYLALEGLRNLISTADRLFERSGQRSELLGILLTMVDYRTKASRDNVERIRRKFRNKVFAVEIRVNTRLAEAPEEGRTIFQYDPTATGAKAYQLLAAEVLIRATAVRRTSARPSRAARRAVPRGQPRAAGEAGPQVRHAGQVERQGPREVAAQGEGGGLQGDQAAQGDCDRLLAAAGDTHRQVAAQRRRGEGAYAGGEQVAGAGGSPRGLAEPGEAGGDPEHHRGVAQDDAGDAAQEASGTRGAGRLLFWRR